MAATSLRCVIITYHFHVLSTCARGVVVDREQSQAVKAHPCRRRGRRASRKMDEGYWAPVPSKGSRDKVSRRSGSTLRIPPKKASVCKRAAGASLCSAHDPSLTCPLTALASEARPHGRAAVRGVCPCRLAPAGAQRCPSDCEVGPSRRTPRGRQRLVFAVEVAAVSPSIGNH